MTVNTTTEQQRDRYTTTLMAEVNHSEYLERLDSMMKLMTEMVHGRTGGVNPPSTKHLHSVLHMDPLRSSHGHVVPSETG